MVDKFKPMHLCVDFHVGPSKEYLIFSCYYKLCEIFFSAVAKSKCEEYIPFCQKFDISGLEIVP